VVFDWDLEPARRGRLVYEHGAAQAYVTAGGALPAEGAALGDDEDADGDSEE
jgi:hypothetical protein